jgi:hypothetical protein
VSAAVEFSKSGRLRNEAWSDRTIGAGSISTKIFGRKLGAGGWGLGTGTAKNSQRFGVFHSLQ